MAEDCLEAYKNPSCPYVTQININTACMKQVDRALISLLGKDGPGYTVVDYKTSKKVPSLNELKKMQMLVFALAFKETYPGGNPLKVRRYRNFYAGLDKISSLLNTLMPT